MASRDFSFYGNFAPSPALTSPDHHDYYRHQNDLASPMATPQTVATTTTTSGVYASSDAVVKDAWARYDAAKRAEEAKNALLEVCTFLENYLLKSCLAPCGYALSKTIPTSLASAVRAASEHITHPIVKIEPSSSVHLPVR